MPEHIKSSDLELLKQLGLDTGPETTSTYTALQQRIIAGFEEIERFVLEKGRLPQHGEANDIFERMYAVRLDRIRAVEEYRKLLAHRDALGMLKVEHTTLTTSEKSDEELLAALGVNSDSDITDLKHVRSREEIKAAEDNAQRIPCKDFHLFKPLFLQVQKELELGIRRTTKYKDNAEINKGDLFILEGQKAFVADWGVPFISDYGREDRRLRVVFDNKTESDLLARSLQRALNRDKASRRIVAPDAAPLFELDDENEADLPSGFVYVLRSKSNHPFVVANKKILHKIGVTGNDVKSRIANARKDPTYLLADVEVVAQYKLSNVNRKALETLLHKCFSSVRLDLELMDRFNFKVAPKEWFLVPLSAIEEAMERIKDGTITDYVYDRESARLVPV